MHNQQLCILIQGIMTNAKNDTNPIAWQALVQMSYHIKNDDLDWQQIKLTGLGQLMEEIYYREITTEEYLIWTA